VLSRKSMKSAVNLDSKLLRTFMTVALAVGTVVLLPVIITAIPFVFAWNLSGVLLEKNAMKNNNDKLESWDSFSVDFSKWKTMDKKNG